MNRILAKPLVAFFLQSCFSTLLLLLRLQASLTLRVGEFTTFDFIPGIPAPFNFGLAILRNQKMLTLLEKIQTIPALLPMLIEGMRFSPLASALHILQITFNILKTFNILGQPFIEAQDELSVTEFMRRYGMPERINEEVNYYQRTWRMECE